MKLYADTYGLTLEFLNSSEHKKIRQVNKENLFLISNANITNKIRESYYEKLGLGLTLDNEQQSNNELIQKKQTIGDPEAVYFILNKLLNTIKGNHLFVAGFSIDVKKLDRLPFFDKEMLIKKLIKEEHISLEQLDIITLRILLENNIGAHYFYETMAFEQVYKFIFDIDMSFQGNYQKLKRELAWVVAQNKEYSALVLTNPYLNKLLGWEFKKKSFMDMLLLTTRGIMGVIAYPLLLLLFSVKCSWINSKYTPSFLRPLDFILGFSLNMVAGLFESIRFTISMALFPFILIAQHFSNPLISQANQSERVQHASKIKEIKAGLNDEKKIKNKDGCINDKNKWFLSAKLFNAKDNIPNYKKEGESSLNSKLLK